MLRSFIVRAVRNLKKKFLYVTAMMAVTFSVLAMAVQAASAAVTLKDTQTIVRTIGFLENSSASGSTMAIVYNPDDSESAQDARQMENFIKNEKSGMKPRLVSVNDLTQVQGANFAFVTGGLQGYYDKIRSALNKNKILSFTLDRACLDQNCCTIYINSKTKVEIILNKAIADAVNATFKPVFLMMVTVI